jgi:type IV secretory pathway TrbL component
MVLAVIIGIGSSYFDQMTGLVGDDPTVGQALTLLMGALTLFGLGIFGPGIASGLVSGAPQLGAGAAVGTAAGAAIMTGGAAVLGARTAMAAVRAAWRSALAPRWDRRRPPLTGWDRKRRAAPASALALAVSPPSPAARHRRA